MGSGDVTAKELKGTQMKAAKGGCRALLSPAACQTFVPQSCCSHAWLGRIAASVSCSRWNWDFIKWLVSFCRRGHRLLHLSAAGVRRSAYPFPAAGPCSSTTDELHLLLVCLPPLNALPGMPLVPCSAAATATKG